LSSANTYLLDIKDYSWKTSYSASEANLPITTTNITSSQQLNITQILIIVFSSLGGLILIVIALFIIIKCRKKKNASINVLEMPSEQQLQQRDDKIPSNVDPNRSSTIDSSLTPFIH
jgi:hypothetical protein